MEFNFQKIVITIAIIMFIVLMCFIAIVLYKGKYDVRFPPIVSQCPDYWIDQQNGSVNIDGTNKQKCVNTQNLGNLSCSKEMDFTGDHWQGPSGSCNKYKWAKSCDLTWDGITNDHDLCK
jgi:hypothetical protein